jgi:hypothetical protein
MDGGVRTGGTSVGSPNTGIYTTPNDNRLLVLARGDAYLIDVQDPTNYEALSTGRPVVVVKPIPRESVLLLAKPWDVTAIGQDEVLWTTGRLAIDGLRLDESQHGRVAGVADPRDLEPRDFDLTVGDANTGAILLDEHRDVTSRLGISDALDTIEAYLADPPSG